MADRRLSKTLRAAIASSENEIAVSAVTFWELAIKKQLGRVNIDLGDLQQAAIADGFVEPPVEISYTLRLESLPNIHRDPFDRLLIAQSIEGGWRLVTRDEIILSYAGTAGFDLLSS